jgi:hypothetical protein
MRDFKGMKRQRGRNRNATGGNKPQQHNANRAFDSNGPEGIKVRGNAQHVFEKYQQLARDAQSGGDRVLAENYLQHAEHYFRLIRVVTPTRAVSDIVGRDAFASGYDIDFEDESGAQAQAIADAAAEEAQAEANAEQPRQDNGGNGQGGQRDFNNNGQQQRNNNNDFQRNRDDRPKDRYRDRDDRPRDNNNNDRPREDRPREDRPQNDRPQNDRPREDRPRDENRPPREDRPRYRDRDDRPRREDRPREERADPMAVVEPQATPLPREDRVREEAPAPRLRGDDGESHMPAFLSSRPPREPKPEAVPTAEAEAKPKRKRTPKAADAE